MPAVAGRSGGAHEAVDDGVTGFVVAPRDTDAVRTVTFSHDCRRLASAGNDRLVRIWDGSPWEGPQQTFERGTLVGHADRALGVAFSPNGEQIASIGGDWTLRFWRRGDENFEAQPGDRIYVFFRIFSPAHFADKVTMRWYWKPQGGGWKLQDSIPIDIVGGREQGFRGYGVKTNHQPGEWKVEVETTDGREIGRVYFTVENVPEGPRALETSLQ